MIGFGLISEGPTDQIVLKNMLGGLFNSKKIFSRNLLPDWDSDDDDSLLDAPRSNNNAVFDYLKTAVFRQFFENTDDFVIIQIDTDALKATEIKTEYRIPLSNLDVESCIEAVKNKFIEVMGADFYEQYSYRMSFAISVDALECWLLPIFYDNEKIQAAKTEGCLKVLNKGLAKAGFKFSIHKKQLGYYREISKPFLKHKDFKRWYILNPSLKIFIEDLSEKIKIEENTEGV
jgi:hypothetical protein